MQYQLTSAPNFVSWWAAPKPAGPAPITTTLPYNIHSSYWQPTGHVKHTHIAWMQTRQESQRNPQSPLFMAHPVRSALDQQGLIATELASVKMPLYVNDESRGTQ